MGSPKQGIVIVMRHGHTTYNEDPERIRGWEDLPLTPKGEKEAKAAAEFITREYLISRVVSSDLKRAIALAEQIAKRAGVTAIKTKDFRPWDMGKLTGQPVAKVKPIMNYFIEHPDQRVPGGESMKEFFERFTPAFRLLLKIAEQKLGAIVLVTHTRDIRVLLGDLATGLESPHIDLKWMEQKEDPLSPDEYLVIQGSGSNWKVTFPKREPK